jgi:hypothetical protein
VQGHRQWLTRALLAAVLLSLAVLALGAAPAQADDEQAAPEPIVVIGVGGLTWQSVDPRATPTLWRLLEDAAAAGTSTLPYLSAEPCPTDGWLTLSAGNRIADPSQRDPESDTRCTEIPVITDDRGTRIGGWPQVQELAQDTVFDPVVGAFGETVADGGLCATAVGAGAALALADTGGRVARYVPGFPHDDPTSVLGCPLTVIDGGSLGPGQGTDVGDVDRLVRAVTASVEPATRVLLVGVSFELEGRRDMGVALLSGAEEPHRFLSVSSTRRDGIVRLQDVPSTVVDWLGLEAPDSFEGAPMRLGGERPDALTTVAELREVADRDRLLRMTAGTFINVLFVGGMVLVAGAVLLPRWRGRPAWSTYAVETLAWTFAALPLASYLVTLTGWWTMPGPLLTLWLFMLVLALALAGVAMLVRHTLWHPVLFLSGATVVLLALDAAVGTPLHHGSPLGPSPMIGGRYYGFGNETFGVFCVHVLLLATAAVTPWLARRRTGPAVLIATGVGLAAVVVEVWPSLGADVGGGLALVPAVLVLALALSGRRVTPVRLALGGLGGVASVLVIGFVDWLRPAPQRTHVGRFFQQILDGSAHHVLLRKADYAIGSFTSGGWAVVALVALLVVLAVQVRREQWSPQALEDAVGLWPPLRSAVLAVTVLTVVGVLGNDYGIRIARITLAVALPVVAALLLRGLRLRLDPRESAAAGPPDGAGVREDAPA